MSRVDRFLADKAAQRKGCRHCGGKRYLIATRGDGRRAVERCDGCAWWGMESPATMSDEDAAKLAQADGIKCLVTYPCYVIEPEGENAQ